ncbi:hypothetical protein COLO4_26768 [Corchorus olitorius]|uniref:Hydroxyproline-rich glycoprotein family protein n=1 Tax=Corchorus olitorius TaxID=93759 RepID=A0A1R3HUR4_9ROSI|nr:hypothetical protein COLO4_26768 [Corchorus olitorius]
MTTSMIMIIISPLLTSLALLALLTTAANARPLYSETSGNSKLKMMITMINNIERSSTSTETSWEITGNDMSESSLIKGKVAPSPPPPISSPPGRQGNFNGGSSSSAPPKPYLSTLTSQLELILSCEEGSLCNSLISMFSNYGKTLKSQPSPSAHQDMIELPMQQPPPPFAAGKTPKSPPSPKPSPPTHQDMIELPSPPFAAGKTPKSPQSPTPAPPKNQHMIELPIKQRSPPFAAAGKTPKSPPSPKPAPSTHQDVIELMQQPSPPFAAGKTPLPPPPPNPAPSTHQDMIELPLQQRSPPAYVRFASS